ncbi:hypothetical protein J5N97_008920 [Dioscorea zingiberensis]|uniref:Non-structural maintenance of chromosomes element 4 n=1 Tax=Dioscorea zingiberensis TaxID=325984 RepID=A0A9D5CYI0_9LILI|nr:hypothetical protein J5N97_008920 [Dioscorea zingiberensis]
MSSFSMFRRQSIRINCPTFWVDESISQQKEFMQDPRHHTAVPFFFEEFWLEKWKGMVCMSISSKALAIIGIDDRRYWKYIPLEESSNVTRKGNSLLDLCYNEEGERITKGSSEKFQSIMSQVESLHKLVKKPREQVSDAEALLDIANTLVTSVRSQTNGMTPSDFVTSMMKNFRKRNVTNMTIWVDVGRIVTPILRIFPGCSTMVGSLNPEIKHSEDQMVLPPVLVLSIPRWYHETGTVCIRNLQKLYRSKLAPEGLGEELIKDCEQIMLSEFSEHHKQIKLRYEEHITLLNTYDSQLEILNLDDESTAIHEGQLQLMKHDFSSSGHGKFSGGAGKS